MNSKMSVRLVAATVNFSVVVVLPGWLWTGASSATFRADFSGDVGRVTAAE
jgi:hypothetical protein